MAQESATGAMELTFGNDATADKAAAYKTVGATSVESYVPWADVEPAENQWDWSKWDKQVAILRGAGLKWVPLLIAGPAYATPLWFQAGPHSHFYRRIEDGAQSRVQSIFNPDMRQYVERFINAFADHYRDSGSLESVLLGISGVFGESIYPIGPVGGWTTKLTGEYPKEKGWWMGDPYAVAAFRDAMRKKYGDIGTLNGAWRAGYHSFDNVAPFQAEGAPSDVARRDFVEWSEQAMTDWAAFWAATARKAFPNAEIYLCTGGNGDPINGADFTAQAAAISKYGVGMRITNEADRYGRNFTVTREVATATRFYGTYCGFEPATTNLVATGVAARIYNATTSGARGLYFYDGNIFSSADNVAELKENIEWLRPRKPEVAVAYYLSRESWELQPELIPSCYQDSGYLRQIVDQDNVTRLTIGDGILKNYRALVIADSPVLEPQVAAAIERWVDGGGILINLTRDGEPLGSRLYDDRAWRARMFAHGLGGLFNRSQVTRVQNGYTIQVDVTDHSLPTAQFLGSILHNSPVRFPGRDPLAPPGSGPGAPFMTVMGRGILWYSPADGRIGMTQ